MNQVEKDTIELLQLLDKRSIIGRPISIDVLAQLNKMSTQQLYVYAQQQVQHYLNFMFVGYDHQAKIYFHPGNTESVAKYTQHLIAGKNSDINQIKTARVLGLILTPQTIAQPLQVIIQENNRLAYNCLYQLRFKQLSHTVIIGTENGQVGRVITSIVTIDQKRDKHASLRDVKKLCTRAKEILVVNLDQQKRAA